MPLALIARLEKTCLKSHVLTITRKCTTQGLLWTQKKRVKKLVSVLAIFAPMTDISRETTLERVPYIWYPVQFYQKNDNDEDKSVRALIDLRSKVNIIHST